MVYWPIVAAAGAIVFGYSNLQARVSALDVSSKDTVKTISLHDVRIAEFSVEQKNISQKVDTIDLKMDRVFDAIQKLKR